MVPAVIDKLEEVFALGGSDKEACFWADISTQTLYDYQNLHPGFVERKEALKESSILLARRTVVDGLKKSPDLSLRYLERKRSDEFGPKTKVEHSGKVEGTVDPKMVEIAEEYEEKLKQAIIEKRRGKKS